MFIRGQISRRPPNTAAVFEMRPPRTKNVRSVEKNQWCSFSLFASIHFARSSADMPASRSVAAVSISRP